MKSCKIAIIGGGPGGYVAAIKAAQLGASVVLIEKDKIGGLCLNYGCIPTKALYKSARLLRDLKDAKRYGIELSDNAVGVNWDGLMKRKNKVVTQMVSQVEALLQKNGVEVILGDAKALSANLIAVNGIEIQCEYLILATGASVAIPPFPGMTDAIEAGIAIDSSQALSLPQLPKTMAVLGGGTVAVEFSTLFGNLGTEVLMIHRSDQILKHLDQDVQESMRFHLEREGVNVATDIKVVSIDGHSVHYEEDGLPKKFEAEKILIGLGRKPNLEGLEALGLEFMSGSVKTNQFLETSVKGVYAVGDLNGKQMLAHVASAEGILAVEHILGKEKSIDYLKIPSCIYSFPEVGTLGMTELETKESGKDYTVRKISMSTNSKAMAEGDHGGFIKLIENQAKGEVLGVHIVASHATDMIAEAASILALGGGMSELSQVIHPHPTLTDALF